MQTADCRLGSKSDCHFITYQLSRNPFSMSYSMETRITGENYFSITRNSLIKCSLEGRSVIKHHLGILTSSARSHNLKLQHSLQHATDTWPTHDLPRTWSLSVASSRVRHRLSIKSFVLFILGCLFVTRTAALRPLGLLRSLRGLLGSVRSLREVDLWQV